MLLYCMGIVLYCPVWHCLVLFCTHVWYGYDHAHVLMHARMHAHMLVM